MIAGASSSPGRLRRRSPGEESGGVSDASSGRALRLSCGFRTGSGRPGQSNLNNDPGQRKKGGRETGRDRKTGGER